MHVCGLLGEVLREYVDTEGVVNVNGDYMQRSLVFIGSGYAFRQTIIKS